MEQIRLLLVDDCRAFLHTLIVFLQARGSEKLVIVGTAGTGKIAIEKAHLLKPDVILLDLGLPDVSGLEVISVLKDTQSYTKIVVMTLQDDDAHRQAALTAGADGFVSKAHLATDLMPALS